MPRAGGRAQRLVRAGGELWLVPLREPTDEELAELEREYHAKERLRFDCYHPRRLCTDRTADCG